MYRRSYHKKSKNRTTKQIFQRNDKKKHLKLVEWKAGETEWFQAPPEARLVD
jgi:hypothetical protein